MMNRALLSTTYFGPIQWYQKLHRYPSVMMESMESFPKQTFRNRCVIATANGPQALSVPVEPPSRDIRSVDDTPTASVHKATVRDIRISDHGNWRHLHRQALVSAYGDSPFFPYYADDILPFFEKRWVFLYDFNLEITLKMCELLDIHPHIGHSSAFLPPDDASLNGGDRTADDFRYAIRPKHPLPDDDFQPKPYYQVFKQKQGFLPNLSILDLLFNEGNESIFYL